MDVSINSFEVWKCVGMGSAWCGGGHSTLGYAPCAPYFYSLAFTERPPFLPTLT